MNFHNQMKNYWKIKMTKFRPLWPIRTFVYSIFVIFLSLVLVAACVGNSRRINKINLGMSKKDVIKILGQPISTSAINNTEYLKYRFKEESSDGYSTLYYVRLIGGTVDSFGRAGDFDSSKDPTVKIKSESTIKVTGDSIAKQNDDIYTTLTKYKELLDKGLITKDEYEVMKKRY